MAELIMFNRWHDNWGHGELVVKRPSKFVSTDHHRRFRTSVRDHLVINQASMRWLGSGRGRVNRQQRAACWILSKMLPTTVL